MKSLLRKAVACLLACLYFVMTDTSANTEETIDFVERFALAENREEVLATLIPGTPDYYYYHAIHYVNEGEWDKLASIMEPWVKRYGETDQVWEARNREALLRYGENPEKSLGYLKDRLNLSFSHQRQRMDARPDLPTVLDQGVISWDAFMERASRNPRKLNQLEDSGLDRFLRAEPALDNTTRRELLSRLTYPDYGNLTGIIAADLRTRESRGFGEFGIHQNLLPDQLEELARLVPELVRDPNYVYTRIAKLHPGADRDWRRDPDARERYLEALWDYVESLDPSFNSLKVHTLYQLLRHHRSLGEYPDGLWMAYLELPRPGPYIEPRFLATPEAQRNLADPGADFSQVTRCPPVGQDESLVREYLLHALRDLPGVEKFAAVVKKDYLEELLAEAKLTAGIGDAEQWFSLLNPSALQRLKDRVDIAFLPSNLEQFLPGDEVVLAAEVKNVTDLVVKVFEINALNYYLDTGREINTDLDLDGLIPNEELRFRYEEAPIRRVRRSFSLESLRDRRGVWMVELIGNGVSSRALVRKGQLQYVSQPTATGTVLTILDEANAVAPEASVWFGGREYEADEEGRILLPFSETGSQQIILNSGVVAALDRVELPAEEVRLRAGFHVDRETLLPGAECAVLVRPELTVGGAAAPVSWLEDVKLTLSSTDLDGITSSQEVVDFALTGEDEAIHRFRVPQRLQEIRFTLEGRVPRISEGGKKVVVNDSRIFSINGIDESSATGDFHLSRIGGEYWLELLGKSGEALADRSVTVSLDHEDFTLTWNVSLKSDERGRISLGALAGIETIAVNGSGLMRRQWFLHGDRATVPGTVQAAAGTSIEIPRVAAEGEVGRPEIVILERRGGAFVRDVFAKVKTAPGRFVIDGLEPGDYEVFLRGSEDRVQVRVTASEEAALGFALSDYRHLEVGNTRPLQITGVDPEDGEIRISLANAGPDARVHVFATRFLPEFPAPENLGLGRARSLAAVGRGGFESRYVSGRDIGEEYRYILERRAAKKFPGNMLSRPGLILNPWALRDTETSVDDAEEGEEFRKSAPASGAVRTGKEEAGEEGRRQSQGQEEGANLDFLAEAAPVALNLKPDEEGTIVIPGDFPRDRQQLHVVAVDSSGVAYRQRSLGENGGTEFRDLTLKRFLDPAKHYTQKRRVTLLRRGNVLAIPDIRSSEVETYDTIGGVFAVMAGVAGEANPADEATLREFSFILRWPDAAPEQKREWYSRYACHELNFFLSRHDEAFFREVVQPYLRNKRDKTFMDHYLIEADLTAYLEPWRYGRLNIVERILLGRRLGGDTEGAMRRSVSEWMDLRPRDREQLYQFYRSALRGRGLSEGGGVAGTISGRNLELALTQSASEPADRSSLMTRSLRRVSGMASELSNGRRPERDMLDALGDEPESAPAPAAPMVGAAVDGFAAGGVDKKMKFAEEQLLELRERAKGQALYRKLEATREWAENNYYELPIRQQVAALITVNDFWQDYADWDGRGGFYSRHFPAATRNFAEMMLALAVLDLPFSAEEAEIEFTEERMTLEARSPVIVFHEEIEESTPPEDRPDILISQNFYRADDRYEMVEGERVDKFVTREFLTGVSYGCQVVITNPSSSNQRLDLLLQVPEGAVPIATSDYTQTVPIGMSPFSTRTAEVHFYFPEDSGEGTFAHFPAHVSRNEEPVAWADPFRFRVVDRLSEVDTSSWEYLSQNGSDAEVIAFLEDNNIHAIDPAKIAWRVRENVDLFRRVTSLLRDRHAYSDVLWSYGMYHDEPGVAREYLTHQESFLDDCGRAIECELVTIDPVERHWYQHLEYAPLVNARAHRLGRDRKILNDRFRAQYHEFMRVLAYRKDLSARESLGVAYYLFLQDRIEEALAWLDRVEEEAIESRLQFDYLRGYASLYREEPAVAAQIADQYRDHPVNRWRERFRELGDHAREIRGEAGEFTDREDRDQRQEALADADPSIELKIEGSKVLLTLRKIEEVRINYYEMDLEFLFSSQPFVSAGSGQFSYIRPNFTETRGRAGDGQLLEFEIPERFAGRNVLVEAVSEGKRASAPVYANTLDVRLSESYGSLQVRDRTDGSPLPRTYVKVYARFGDGAVRFFKDGYTDLRGRFDYVSLNTDELDRVEKLGILVTSPADGALVKEASPPQR